MKTSSIVIALLYSASVLTGQYQPIPSTSYPALDAILNAKPAMTSGNPSPVSGCTQGRDLYLEISNGHLWLCTGTNVWTDVTGGGGGGGSVIAVTGTPPVTSSGGNSPTIGITGVTAEQGNGAKLQLSTGTTTNGNIVKYDANGNTIDSGVACCTLTGPVPYTQNFTSQTTVTASAATHLQGLKVAVLCWDGNNGTGNNVSCNPTVDSLGNVSVTFEPAFTGSITVFGGGPGPAGAMGPAGVTPGVSAAVGTTVGPTIPGTSSAGTVGVNFLYDKNGRYNVKAFGAKGDGVTDDTTAVNAAAAMGGTYWPCGTYLISAPVRLTSASPTIYGEAAATQPAGSCVTIVQGNSSYYAVTYLSALNSSQYNNNNVVHISNIHIFSLGGGIDINADTIPTPPSYQANLVGAEFDNLYLQGPSTINSDPNAYTAVIPSVSALVGYGVGLRCNQCFNVTLRNSVIQNWGVGLYYAGDEGYIGAGNRITLNGNNIVVTPSIGGATTFTQANNVNIFGNTLGGNLRAGAINLQNDGIGGVKIHNNYFENYCKSSTWVIETNGEGMDFAFNLIDNPNNATLSSPTCTYAGNNTTPQMVLDAVHDIRIHENYLAPNGNSIPGLTLNHTNGNNQQYYIYGNSVNFPNMLSDANVVPSTDLNTYSKGTVTGATFASTVNCVSSASPAVCTSAAAGAIALPVSSTTLVVNTTAITANSQVILTFDASLGTRLGITCNTTVPALYGVSARTAGTSFTLTASSPTTNAACFNYWIVN